MANINLNHENYADYVATYFLKAHGVQDIKFSPRIVNVSGKPTVLIRVTGIQTTTGLILGFDIWPRYEATQDDIQNLPKVIDDMHFRIGYWPEVDGNGNKTMREGKPRWTCLQSGGKEIRLSGERREN